MRLSHHAWQQLKSITAGQLCSALERDGWACDMSGGSMRIYVKGSERVSVHYHPKKTYGPGLLKALLGDIGWTDEDAQRLKLVK